MNNYLVNYVRKDGVIDVVVFKDMGEIEDIYDVLDYLPRLDVEVKNVLSIIKID